MADQKSIDPTKAISTVVGQISAGSSDDGQFAIFQLDCHDGPVQLAIRVADLPRLIATAAHAYTPEMPTYEPTPKDRALPVAGWSIIPARDGSVAFSFQLMPGAALTFLVPPAQREGLLEALNNALGASDFRGPLATDPLH